MVAGARGDHTTRVLVGSKQLHTVGGATDLERARALQILGLQPHIGTRQIRQKTRVQERRIKGDVADPVGGLANAIEVNHPFAVCRSR